MPIMFNSLLESADLDPHDVRLVRHHSSRPNYVRTPYKLWREMPDDFDLYQRIQTRRVFRIGNQLASFIKTPSDETLFIGIYNVDNLEPTPVGMIDPATGEDASNKNLYDLSPSTALAEFRGRLTISWGRGDRTWVQLAGRQNKAVREIRLNVQDEPFPGFFLFRCKLSEIASLPTSWIERLRGAKGIYVLTSTATQAHYVGSAAGAGGFHQRWMQHAAVGGAAVWLQAHDAADYQVAILQVAAGFESDDDIVRTEHNWMHKLQTRGMGLNGQPTFQASSAPQSLL